MKPETRTVNELFERDVRYVVPLYQRPYVWDEEDQWEPLWGDIVVLLDHQLSNGGKPSTYTHFLGAIVLEQEVLAPGRIPQYTVIDGQQRLTTLQLLLAAARTAALSLSEPDEGGILGELIVNDPRKAAGDERLKVWPTNINRAAFRAVLAPPDELAAADDPSNLIQEAFAFFVAKIMEWLMDVEPDERAERLRTLRVTLSDLVKVVSITLEPGDNAQVIFETLNARGTPLLALDLVKNSVFRQAARDGRDVESLYHDVWQPELDQELWRNERRQGRLYRAHGELFLMHWLAMRLRKPVPATELFTTFRREFLDGESAPDISQLIRDLNHDAAIYRSFDDQPSGSREALFFERLEVLDVTTLMPVALLLFTHPSVSPTRRRKALETLETWLVRRMLVRLTTKNYNAEVGQLLAKVAADPEHADEVVQAHLAAATSETSRLPSDGEIIATLEGHGLYNSVTQARIVLILKAIEGSMYDDRVDIPSIPTTLSIEHVMPQSWSKNWPLDTTAGEGLRCDGDRAKRPDPPHRQSHAHRDQDEHDTLE